MQGFKYVIIGHDAKDPTLAQAVLQGIRKNIVGGKGG